MPSRTAVAGVCVPMAGHCWLRPPQETLRQSKSGLSQSLMGATALCLPSWCTQGFVCAPQSSLVGMRFDFKCDCSLLPFVVLSFCPWMRGIFFWWVPTFSCLWLFSSYLWFWCSRRRWVHGLLLRHLCTHLIRYRGLVTRHTLADFSRTRQPLIVMEKR